MPKIGIKMNSLKDDYSKLLLKKKFSFLSTWRKYVNSNSDNLDEFVDNLYILNGANALIGPVVLLGFKKGLEEIYKSKLDLILTDDGITLFKLLIENIGLWFEPLGIDPYDYILNEWDSLLQEILTTAMNEDEGPSKSLKVIIPMKDFCNKSVNWDTLKITGIYTELRCKFDGASTETIYNNLLKDSWSD